MVEQVLGEEIVDMNSNGEAATNRMYSLLRLKQSLREEAYEASDFWIQKALGSGASHNHIREVLCNPSFNLEQTFGLS